jgi:hypothetical protein
MIHHRRQRTHDVLLRHIDRKSFRHSLWPRAIYTLTGIQSHTHTHTHIYIYIYIYIHSIHIYIAYIYIVYICRYVRCK